MILFANDLYLICTLPRNEFLYHACNNPILRDLTHDLNQIVSIMIARNFRTFLGCALITLFLPVLMNAQKKTRKPSGKNELKVPMTAEHWEAEPGKIEFTTYKNVPAIKLLNTGTILKNVDFSIEPLDAPARPFVSCYFRLQNNSEAEVFYLRVGRQRSEKLNDAVQYAPFIKAVNLWDLLPQYQGPAIIHNRDWNHVKIVVSGKQMRAYVNNMQTPALQIPYLEGSFTHGSIGFEGYAAVANLVVTPDAVEDLPSTKGIDLTDHDANYIRKWFVTSPELLENGRELNPDLFPKDGISWDSLNAERNALINVTRKYGVENRRYVWLKATIRSNADVQRKLELGFSDEVWVFVNRRLVYVDKNLYLEGMRKNPNGRCSIQNSSFTIPLKSGDNELLIGLANNFYGWGIIARMENIADLDFTR